MLCGDFTVMQASVSDCLVFDPFSLFQDGLTTSEVDVGRGEIADAFVITLVIVMIDEGFDFCLQVIRKEVVFQQDAVLQGLVPSFDLALCLRMIRCASDMAHPFVFQPVSQITRDVTGTIVG